MREPTTDSAVAYAIALLSHYNFELRGYPAEELVNLWLEKYQANWVRLGVIEALYQGRYKAVSVEQILAVWARRGQPIYRFTHEFERLISRKLPQNLTAPLNTKSTDLSYEYILPSLTPRSLDTPEESESRRQEAMVQDEAPTTIQTTLPPVTTALEEDLTEIPVESEELLSEALTNVSPKPSYDADWSRCEVSKPPIDQFTPPPDSSGFYLKLKAVVQQQEGTSPVNGVTSVINENESQPSLEKN